MKSLDLNFQKGDRIRPRGYFNRAAYGERTIEGFTDGGDLIVGGKTGPKYSDTVTGQVITNAAEWEFACHHAGAPFEKTVLDEEGSYRDGYLGGLTIGGVRGEFYQAGGPYTCSSSSGPIRSCRHYDQYCEYLRKNHAAHQRGWKAGQERAKTMKKLDFSKPLRLVLDEERRVVTYAGNVCPVGGKPFYLINVTPSKKGDPKLWSSVGIQIDAYGMPLEIGDDGFRFAVENTPPEQTYYINVPVEGNGQTNFSKSRNLHLKQIKVRIDGDGNVIEVGVA